jgi:hypothetical protein
VNATINEKSKAMEVKNILFSANLPKPPKSKLCALNARSVVIFSKKKAYVLEK